MDLFCAYDGNHSAMANDGVYDEYKSFSISKETEKKWLLDIQKFQIAKITDCSNIKLSFSKSCLAICRTKDIDSVELLSKVFLDDNFLRLSSSAKVYMCESFVDMLSVFQQSEWKNKYKSLVLNLLTTIEKQDSSDLILRKTEFVKNKLNEI